MPSYSIHWDEQGRCHNCEDLTPYLFHSDRRVDGGLNWPMTVAIWVCSNCLDRYGSEEPTVLSDEMVREFESTILAPFEEWGPE